jgi:hypothetical protein
MTRSGIAYQLPSLVPLTYGTGFGSSPSHSIPTPTAQDHIERRETFGQLNPETNKAVTLARFVGFWPTPTEHGNYNKKGLSAKSGNGLATAVKMTMWPTPTVVTNTGGAALCKWGGSGARKKLKTMVTPAELNGSLNPTWVEWLMGFPLGWTDLGPSETPSSRKSQNSLAARSFKRKG